MNNYNKQGKIFIISAPSGTGKTTLCSAVLKKFPQIEFSISYTTRKPRKGETHGKEYFFIPVNEFKNKIDKEQWAEWASVHGNYYGTLADTLNKIINTGKNIILDIDVKGAKQILKQYPESITIFIMPPDADELKKRLILRNTDDTDVINKRIQNAKKEILQKDLYKHIIINDKLSDAVKEMTGLFKNYLVL